MTQRTPTVKGILSGAFAVAVVASLLAVTPAASASPAQPRAAAASSLPTVTPVPAGSGSHGYPYDAAPATPSFPGAPTLNLAARGYTEDEFFMSGTTNIYQQSGFWGTNGQWGISVAQSNVPYTTRLLVRYPRNPAKFNGTVIIEWLNDTTGGDQDPVWADTYREILSAGFAYIGVTAQTEGMNELKAWDSQRYGSLGDTNDGQSYDIFTQAAQVARADAGNLLGGLIPARVIGAGDSQSAFRVDTYVNAIQPVSHAFNGFLAIGRSVFAAPLGSGLVMTSPAPAYVRTDNTTPFMQLNTEGDIEELGAALVRQPDNNYLRTWELAGASHIDLHEGLYEAATIEREEPTLTAPSCVFGVVANGGTLPDDMGLYELEDAALAAMNKWIVSGVAPAHGNQISTTPLFNVVERDQYGNALGGIRMPDIQVPTQTFTAINFSAPSQESLNPVELLSTLEAIFTALETGEITNTTLRDEGLCLLEGFYTPLRTATLQSLYPTHADYVTAYTAAAASDLASGFLTKSDYSAAVAAAKASTVP
jgi:Alpha/beta hydrolase domain